MTNQFLIQVGNLPRFCSNPQGSCNENIGSPSLFLDGSNVANGIEINSVMGTTVGPQTYLLNFTGYGVKVTGGHEVMIDETWFGERNFDHNFTEQYPPQATAIAIGSNDHYVVNSIVFAAKIGIDVSGAANFIAGLHVWFPWNRATRFAGVAAFFDNGKLNRYSGCYVDGSTAVFKNADNMWWLDGFILGGGRGIEFTGDKDIQLVQIANTAMEGGGISLKPDTAGKQLQATDVRIENNQFGSGHGRPRARRRRSPTSPSPRARGSSISAIRCFFRTSHACCVSSRRRTPASPSQWRGRRWAVPEVETSTPMSGRITVEADSAHVSDPCLLC
jgi:hypothetical protein